MGIVVNVDDGPVQARMVEAVNCKPAHALLAHVGEVHPAGQVSAWGSLDDLVGGGQERRTNSDVKSFCCF